MAVATGRELVVVRSEGKGLRSESGALGGCGRSKRNTLPQPGAGQIQ